VIDALSRACGEALLDLHRDADHHRSVFTLAGPGSRDAVGAAQSLARVVAEKIDLRQHEGVHPRLGALDVVPFTALDEDATAAVPAALDFAAWVAHELGLPVFLYDGADAAGRSLPEARRAAFTSRPPDRGPSLPDPRLGAVAVGARPPLVAVNCWLSTLDVKVARAIASAVRERDGGFPGVRALGLSLERAQATQVAMNLVDLTATGVETACTAVRRGAATVDVSVTRVELVGLMPASELARCSPAFLEWARLYPDDTIEYRLDR